MKTSSRVGLVECTTYVEGLPVQVQSALARLNRTQVDLLLQDVDRQFRTV